MDKRTDLGTPEANRCTFTTNFPSRVSSQRPPRSSASLPFSSAQEEGGVNVHKAVLCQWLPGVGGYVSQAPSIQKDNCEVHSTQVPRELSLGCPHWTTSKPSLLFCSPCPVHSSFPHSSFQESLPGELPVPGSVLRGNHLRQPSLQGTFPGGGPNEECKPKR